MRLSRLTVAIGALTLSAAAAHAAGFECSPLIYGAVGDGITDDTAAIQSAIDACEAKYGGGVVRLSTEPGKTKYLTGPIRLANHIRLQLDKGVTLLGSTDHGRYQVSGQDSAFRANEALISAYQVVDAGVVGPGTIDGQGGMPAGDGGESWWALTQANGTARPWLVEFYQCTGVTVNDVTFRNAPTSSLVLRYSNSITVSELSIVVTPDPRTSSTDGIDVIGSSDATLIFLDIASGGDSVALKSGLAIGGPGGDYPNQASLPQVPTHDIQIVNSRFSNGSGIAIGGESAGGVYNVVASNITAIGTRHGLQIKADHSPSKDAADYNIRLENADLTDVRQPLVIGAEDRSNATMVEPSDDLAWGPITGSRIHDVTVLNLTATGAGQPSRISGLPGACVRNVTLDNVRISGSGAAMQLRDMTGTFTNVILTPPVGMPPFLVRQNVAVTTAGTTPSIANMPPAAPSNRPGQACGDP